MIVVENSEGDVIQAKSLFLGLYEDLGSGKT